MSVLIGIDVGGTFTDFSCFDADCGELFYYKVSSTPDDPSRAIINGLKELLSKRGIAPCDISYLAHGTTVATNALIQKKGGKTGLITTKGFRDLLEIGRQTRPSLYELDKAAVPPIIPGKYRCEVSGRLLYDGSEYQALDEEEVREKVQFLKKEGITAIAVCTLFSFVNPEHEQRIEEILKEDFPGAYVSVSNRVVPEFREFSRMSTTVVNAFLGPVMEQYVTNFQNSIQALGIQASPYITQSNGSIISIQETKKCPVRTALSGPSAGVVAAEYVTSMCGIQNLITFDMGGTSADISLISGTGYRLATEKLIEGYTLRTPMIDIETVGAGGGSIAYVDSGGALKVGPQSAGAKPGPAAYNRGGVKPTVTDANVILGRLNPQCILGGRMDIRKDLAEEALRREICDKTGLSVIDAAKGVIAVVNSNMVRTTRIVSVERGYDVREFALVAFGGAGPLHACEIACELGITTVIIPPSPGTLCSLGLLAADIKYDYARTAMLSPCEESLDQILKLFLELEKEGKAFLDKEGVSGTSRRFVRSVDARYKMQNYELTVPVEDGPVDLDKLLRTVEAFHIEHEKNYGYCDRTQPVQLVNFRLTAVGQRQKPLLKIAARQHGTFEPAARRLVYFDQKTKFVDCPIYDRESMYAGDQVEGPAVMEQMDSTVVIMPGWRARLEETGILRLDFFAEGEE